MRARSAKVLVESCPASNRVDELRNSWGFAGKKLEFVETATESLVVQVGRCMSATTNCGYRSHHHRVVPVLC
jgi:isopenicillin N synthase-like dioxygenase